MNFFSSNACLILIIILCGSILIGLYWAKIFKGYRLFYLSLFLTNTVVIIGRFACEDMDCLINLPEYLMQFLFNQGKITLDCNNCEPDWSLRAGIDEAGLILMGFSLGLIVLWYKNENPYKLFTRISKINLFGVIEVEYLNKEIDGYIKKYNISFDRDTLKELTEEEEALILKTSSDVERLDLISIIIEKRLIEILEVKTGEEDYFQIDIYSLIFKLKEIELIDNEFKEIITNFFKLKVINATQKKGQMTIGLIELGRKILRIIRGVIKKVFTKNRKFFGHPRRIKLDRIKFQEVSLKNVILATTVSLSDSNNNYFLLDDKLGVLNFSVKETLGGQEVNVPIEKVEILQNTFSKLGIAIALDCSDSMKSNEKLLKSKEAISLLFSDLLNFEFLDTEVHVVTFNNDKVETLGDAWSDLRTEEKELKRKLNAITTSGSTPLYKALLKTLDLFKKEGHQNRYNLILCLSDGVDSTNKQSDFDKLVSTVKDMRIPIISIGFGDEPMRELKDISNLSGAGEIGVGFFQASQPSELKGIFDDVIFSISKSYKIWWKPSFPALNKKIKVKITVNYVTQFQVEKSSTIDLGYELQE